PCCCSSASSRSIEIETSAAMTSSTSTGMSARAGRIAACRSIAAAYNALTDRPLINLFPDVEFGLPDSSSWATQDWKTIVVGVFESRPAGRSRCCGGGRRDVRRDDGEQRRYGDLVFGETLLFAARGANEQLRFTRHERALLELFMQNPNRLLSRGHILDAITHTGSDISDRNVDFLVNRLRAKLGDSARAPRFIATQYGEGYVWIAKPEESVNAFIVIGPCHGLGHAATEAMARPMLAGLAEALNAATEQRHGTVVK